MAAAGHGRHRCPPNPGFWQPPTALCGQSFQEGKWWGIFSVKCIQKLPRSDWVCFFYLALPKVFTEVWEWWILRMLILCSIPQLPHRVNFRKEHLLGVPLRGQGQVSATNPPSQRVVGSSDLLLVQHPLLFGRLLMASSSNPSDLNFLTLWSRNKTSHPSHVYWAFMWEWKQ